MHAEGWQWKSPYQTEGFAYAAARSGFAVSTMKTNIGTLYFCGTQAQQIAWEASADTQVRASELEAGKTCLRHCSVDSGATIASERHYDTLVLSDRIPRFNGRFRRSVGRADKLIEQPVLVDLRTPADISAALRLFDERPECRDHIDRGDFQTLVLNLVTCECVEVFGLAQHAGEEELLGVACVLRNEDGSQRNLRFYVASRGRCAGPLLHFLLINRIFCRAPDSLIDLSGLFLAPATDKERGINEFKRQIGGVPVRFERLEGITRKEKEGYHA